MAKKGARIIWKSGLEWEKEGEEREIGCGGIWAVLSEWWWVNSNTGQASE